MKTSRAVILTIFVMSMLNVLTFWLEKIPQGCYTMASIVTAAWLVFDFVYEGDHIKYYQKFKNWLERE